MTEIIRKRLAGYGLTDAIHEQQALNETLQSIALYGLWRVDFFSVAAFQGGTALRILYGLPRFSEDLDFICKRPTPDFRWADYSDGLLGVLAEYGVHCEFVDRARADGAVRAAFLKDDSIAGQLEFSYVGAGRRPKQKVKLEIDTNPPAGSGWDFWFVDFPLDFEVCAQDLSSNFALKLHALLCRPYTKGRDWFDFAWYCRQRLAPNLKLLANALNQTGPWAGRNVAVDADWLAAALDERIQSIDWTAAKGDVSLFLRPIEQPGLNLWDTAFFGEKVRILTEIIGGAGLRKNSV